MTEPMSKIVSHDIREVILAQWFELRFGESDTWVDDHGNEVIGINLDLLDYGWYNDDKCREPNVYHKEIEEGVWPVVYDFDDFDEIDCRSPVAYILIASWYDLDGCRHTFAVRVTESTDRPDSFFELAEMLIDHLYKPYPSKTSGSE